ncbi:5626_t:CDS:2 [Ambispora gerdemannii]|uniref:5626_t:CDS:1 n=1 Tax=Ambispora gerdemannii TaxID=144530 RepID=A0A9N9FZ96_9GLOM|nr:5626_t:CDS:2 [Ambispora gerdemannii]
MILGMEYRNTALYAAASICRIIVNNYNATFLIPSENFYIMRSRFLESDSKLS